MKIVIISDVHGNYEALFHLPEDYDQLWVLGDLVNYGPQLGEVLSFVRNRTARVVRAITIIVWVLVRRPAVLRDFARWPRRHKGTRTQS